MPWVIASGDEGLQLNSGVRFAFAGSGFHLPHFDLALQALRQLMPAKQSLYLASMQEDDWLSRELQSKNPNLYQEQLTSFATQNNLTYAGQFDYGDPRELDETGIKGHLVRPPKVHVADRICLTVGGGEQTYNLRHFVISADFVSALQPKEAQELITTQIDFYRQLTGEDLPVTFETDGPLSAEVKKANQQVLASFLQLDKS